MGGHLTARAPRTGARVPPSCSIALASELAPDCLFRRFVDRLKSALRRFGGTATTLRAETVDVRPAATERRATPEKRVHGLADEGQPVAQRLLAGCLSVHFD